MSAPPDDAPFPLGSVQAVATRAWELCLREDPVGLLGIPFLISFPVYVFLTILGELIRHPESIPEEKSLLGAVFGVLPLVVFARVFGEAWTLWRADSDAHGRHATLGETAQHSFGRSWYLVVVMITVYVLFQIGFFFFALPGLLVAMVCSFANQAAVLGPGRLLASLRQSRELVEHNLKAWFGMVAYWAVVFLGLGIIVTILRFTFERVVGGPLTFALDLVLGLPLQISLLAFTTCWTLFYRELEARRRRHLSLAHAAPAPPAQHPDMPARAS